MSAFLPEDVEAYALAAFHAAFLLAVLWLGAWAVFWRGTTAELARLDAELQRQKYQVSASEAEARRLAGLIRQLEDRQVAEARFGAAAVAPRTQANGYDIGIRMAGSGASDAEIAAACGMSREEAALLQRLHGRRARTAA